LFERAWRLSGTRRAQGRADRRGARRQGQDQAMPQQPAPGPQIAEAALT